MDVAGFGRRVLFNKELGGQLNAPATNLTNVGYLRALEQVRCIGGGRAVVLVDPDSRVLEETNWGAGRGGLPFQWMPLDTRAPRARPRARKARSSSSRLVAAARHSPFGVSVPATDSARELRVLGPGLVLTNVRPERTRRPKVQDQ